MDLETAAGRLMLVGIEQSALDEELARLLAEVRPGGIISFEHNIAGAAEFARLVHQIVEALAEPAPPSGPPLLAIDLEGGRVDRLRRVLAPFPSARAITATNDDIFMRDFGALVGEALASFGLNVDLAPVLDLATPESEPVLGDRAVSGDPVQVTRFARNFLAGLKRAGVLGCAKHFPGLGAASGDTHLEPARVEKTAEHLWEADLLPFRELHAELPLVMMSHALYPALEPEGAAPRPASLSPAIIGGLLRERIGFRGLVVSDDLSMGAVLSGRSVGEAAVAAVEAGCDVLLICRDAENIRATHRALVERARQDADFAARVDIAAGRVEALQKEMLKTATVRGPQKAPDWDRLAEAIGHLSERAEHMGTLAAAMPRFTSAAARPQRGRGGGGRGEGRGRGRREGGPRGEGRGRRGPRERGHDRDRGPRDRGPRGPRGRDRRPPREGP